MGEKRRYTISELAREFDVTPRTIRFYEERGWITPLREGQKRIYRHKDRTRLRLILRGKRIGLSLEESVGIIDLYDSVSGDRHQLDVLLARITEQRDALKQQIADIEATLTALDDTEAKVREALTGARSRPRRRATK